MGPIAFPLPDPASSVVSLDLEYIIIKWYEISLNQILDFLPGNINPPLVDIDHVLHQYQGMVA